MWWYRLRWYILVHYKRTAANHPVAAISHGGRIKKAPGFLTAPILVCIIIVGLILLKSIWNVFMNGFLASTPWVPGMQTGTYYWNSIMFAMKCTALIGVAVTLIAFVLGIQVKNLFKK